MQDLYAASEDNQTFLHARFALGGDVLKPYKITIDRWLWPDVLKNQDTSVARAKKAITDYKKALGQPKGLAELTVFYCQGVFAFLTVCGMEYEDFHKSLVRMFEQALNHMLTLPAAQRPACLDRLDRVRRLGHDVSGGWVMHSTPCGSSAVPFLRLDKRHHAS